jgi:hypothetical protein
VKIEEVTVAIEIYAYEKTLQLLGMECRDKRERMREI